MKKIQASFANNIIIGQAKIYCIYSGIIKLRDLLSFSPIDILCKAADRKSYHAILEELKDKEIYNMIVDIHDTENMSEFLKAV